VSSFSNKTVVITGASSGIGHAIAHRLAKEGAVLCLVGRKLEALTEIQNKVEGLASRVLCYQADLTIEHELVELEDKLKRNCDRVDALIHSAGVISLGTMADSSVEDLDGQYRTNVRAPYHLTQALLPLLRKSLAQVVFINSSVAQRAPAKFGQYAATKHGLKAIADSFRDEINVEGVRVLSVYLGRTATPMQASVHEREGKEYYPESLVQPEDVASTVIHALHMPRTVEITDISMRPLCKAV
jgi:NADP-dependent 3-hydroxy acid dehydrogenase YdfG